MTIEKLPPLLPHIKYFLDNIERLKNDVVPVKMLGWVCARINAEEINYTQSVLQEYWNESNL